MTQKELDIMPAEKKIALLEVIVKKPVVEEWEAALYMSRSVGAMRELRYKFKIDYIKDGRTIRYRRRDLDAYNELKLVPAMV